MRRCYVVCIFCSGFGVQFKLMLCHIFYIMRKFSKLGNLLISDFLAVPVVAFWYSTWSLQDRYLFPDYLTFSSGLSLTIGVVGLSVTALTQFSLTKHLKDKGCLAFFLISRLIALFWAIFGVCHWRGMWNILDIYAGSVYPEILLTGGLLLLGLCRSIRNILATPFVVGFDGHRKQFFCQTMICNKVTHRHFPYGLDVFLSISIIGSLIVVFWRDAWMVIDKHLFPEDKTKTILFSAVIFISIQILAEIFQILFRMMSDRFTKWHYIIRLLIQDVYFIVVGIGNVACWRATWKTIDAAISNIFGPVTGVPITFALSYILLVCMCSCTSVVSKGFVLDGELEKWYLFHNDFIGNVQSCIQDTEKKEEKEIQVEFIVHL